MGEDVLWNEDRKEMRNRFKYSRNIFIYYVHKNITRYIGIARHKILFMYDITSWAVGIR